MAHSIGQHAYLHHPLGYIAQYSIVSAIQDSVLQPLPQKGSKEEQPAHTPAAQSPPQSRGDLSLEIHLADGLHRRQRHRGRQHSGHHQYTVPSRQARTGDRTPVRTSPPPVHKRHAPPGALQRRAGAAHRADREQQQPQHHPYRLLRHSGLLRQRERGHQRQRKQRTRWSHECIRTQDG